MSEMVMRLWAILVIGFVISMAVFFVSGMVLGSPVAMAISLPVLILGLVLLLVVAWFLSKYQLFPA